MLNSDMTETDPFAPDYSQGLPTLGLGQESTLAPTTQVVIRMPNIPIMIGAAALIAVSVYVDHVSEKRGSEGGILVAKLMMSAGWLGIPISFLVAEDSR